MRAFKSAGKISCMRKRISSRITRVCTVNAIRRSKNANRSSAKAVTDAMTVSADKSCSAVRCDHAHRDLHVGGVQRRAARHRVDLAIEELVLGGACLLEHPV